VYYTSPRVSQGVYASLLHTPGCICLPVTYPRVYYTHHSTSQGVYTHHSTSQGVCTPPRTYLRVYIRLPVHTSGCIASLCTLGGVYAGYVVSLCTLGGVYAGCIASLCT